MSSSHNIETLVSATASDGLALPGIHIAHSANRGGTCIVWFNGFGLSYDYRPYLSIGHRVAAAGTGFISATARGHHGAVTGWQVRGGRLRTRKIGSWFEIFDESALDIAAWINQTRSSGYERVILGGHSFGAPKIMYYLATAEPVIDGLILASPSSGIARLDRATVDLARQYMADGWGERLLPDGSWPNGFGTTTVSAQTLDSWARVSPLLYGNDVSWRRVIACPVLCYFGDAGDIGTSDDLARWTRGMDRAASVTTTILTGVSHGCHGAEDQIARAIIDWLATSDLAAAGSGIE